MDEQDYKNLITVYQNKYSDAINQNIALEARELKYRRTKEVLNQQITELENKDSKPKRTSKTTDDNTF